MTASSNYGGLTLTDEDIDSFEAEFLAQGFDGSYMVAMCKSARQGNVSSINALKMMLMSKRHREAFEARQKFPQSVQDRALLMDKLLGDAPDDQMPTPSCAEDDDANLKAEKE